METTAINDIEENDFSNVIIVIGIIVMINILFSCLGLDVVETGKHMVSNLTTVIVQY